MRERLSPSEATRAVGGMRTHFMTLAATAAMLFSISSAQAQWKSPPPGGGFGPIWGGGKNGAAFMEGVWYRECGVPGRPERARYLAVYQYNPAWIYAQCYERVTRQYLPRPGQQRPGMPY